MWIRFTADHNWVQPGFTIAYKAGMIENVTRECAEEAITAGKALKAPTPRREREVANGKKA
ncbi:hypothetical protein [Ensifer sp.]|jgi:hypothetical protein|uniref:hypothetical protein n=1 Tax=Ensifer sp. TaxID=1872086 RepID=UPI002E0D513B|nr:hypothetical protein [Ensifer sp.]